MIVYALQVIIKDDGRCDGIDTRLVASVTFLHATVDHRLVGYRAGEALIIHHHGHVGQLLFQAIDKGGDVFHALAGLAIELGGQDAKMIFFDLCLQMIVLIKKPKI